MKREARVLHPEYVRLAYAVLCGLSAVAACDGTHTTNPIEVPVGAQLVKSSAPRDQNPSLSADAAKALNAGNRQFACDLYRELADASENLFFSPYSLSVALAMTYAGAAGDTRSEMRNALHFDLEEPELHTAFDATTGELERRAQQLSKNSSAGTGFQLSIVNQAWGQKGYAFEDAYLDVLAQHYGSGLLLTDLSGQTEASRTLINRWVADQTNQRVKDLLPKSALSANTRLVLTNAVYFKASWFNKFNPADTGDATFYAPGAERSVRFMHSSGRLNYTKGESYSALELPYASDAVRMLIIAPDAEQFAAVSGGFGPALLDEIQASLKPASVTLSLPRWSFSVDLEQRLKEALQSLGMRTAFTVDADFSRISANPELYVDGVYHQAFVAVDEQGTEASAATGVVVATKGILENVALTLDHPFLFVIYDQPTGQLLFVGQLVDPG